MTPGEALLASADHLEQVGWRRGYSLGGANRGEPVCALGAIVAVVGLGEIAKEASRRLALQLDVTCISRWNDNLPHEAGKDTVASALRAAADLEVG